MSCVSGSRRSAASRRPGGERAPQPAVRCRGLMATSRYCMYNYIYIYIYTYTYIYIYIVHMCVYIYI